jgi:hypothetical protein
MERLRRNRCCTGLPSRPRDQHWGVTAHAVTQPEHSAYHGFSCCYFLWKKVTKELCGIGTHASIAAPRAIGFGACGVCEAEKVCCTLHRNLTPSIEASLRAPPPIPRARVLESRRALVSWSGPRCSWGSGGDESLSGIMLLLCCVGGSGRCPDPVRCNAFGVTGVARDSRPARVPPLGRHAPYRDANTAPTLAPIAAKRILPRPSGRGLKTHLHFFIPRGFNPTHKSGASRPTP